MLPELLTVATAFGGRVLLWDPTGSLLSHEPNISAHLHQTFGPQSVLSSLCQKSLNFLES